MTPATKLLDKAKVAYQLHRYTHDPQAESYGGEAADKLGLEHRRVFKTLLAASETGELLVAVVPVSDKLNLKALAAAAKVKKTAMAEDFPAFIVNRILLPMINEAIYALYEGVGTVESIDTAMRLGAHHPMGPLQLADFIGLDTCHAIMQVLYEGLADSKYRPCPLLAKYVEADWLGRKTGRGFYDYSGETPVPTR